MPNSVFFSLLKSIFIRHIFVFIVCTPFCVFAGEITERDINSAVKDYGVRGHLFNIAEISIMEEIASKLKAAEKDGSLAKLQEKFTNKVKQKVLHPNPVEGIVKATQDRSWTYNPTYTQHSYIKDGKGRIIVAAGTSVNALEKLQWGDPLIFIDGDDESQVEWVINRSGKIILTNGSPLELQKKLNRQIYFDQGGILCHRFKIEAVPALVEQEGLLLRVKEVKI